MNLSRRSFLASATGLLGSTLLDGAVVSGAAPAAAVPRALPPLRLRGYGTLSGTFRRSGRTSITQIHCDSAEKARLVQAKYLSDLQRLPGATADHLAVSGAIVAICRAAAGGGLACFARGSTAWIVAADTLEDLRQAIQSGLPQASTTEEFTARVPVPMYLDRWDRYGLLIYYAPLTAPASVPFPGDAYDYNQDLQFAHESDVGLVLWIHANGWDTAEGMTNEAEWNWVQQGARQLAIPMHLNTNDRWPLLWLSNRYREETQLRMPQYIGGFYDVGWMSGTQGALSYFAEAGEDALLGVQQSMIRHHAADPNIVGYLEPHGETSQLPSSLFCEYGPVADRSLQRYLKGRFGSLAAVSRRWHGDAGHYRTWEDIRAPEMAEFAGFGPAAIDLQGTWRVKWVDGSQGKPDSTPPAEWYQPDFDDSSWDELVAPGNDRMIAMPRAPMVYRRTIEIPAAWLAGKPEVTLYVWDLSDQPEHELVACVNGVKLEGEQRAAMRHRWGVFHAGAALKAGTNLVAILAPRSEICYRIYLSTEPPRQYPHLGPQLNARWADYNAWTLAARQRQLRRGAEMIRQVDPDSSINFMSPGDDLGSTAALCRDFGGRFHDTGAMAGFWTDHNSLMMAGSGLPATAEPGNGAPNIAEFQKFWGRWLTEGLNGIHYFQHLGEIMWNPEVLAEFRKNRALYESIGKYHAPFAEVAVLYSTISYRLTAFPWDTRFNDAWTPGGYYSQANAAAILLDYCPRDGISEDELGAQLAERYRVVIDSNTPFMSDELVGEVEAYVRAGGVFITNGQTGRHTEVDPDSWPISRLSGYSVGPTRGGSVALAPGQGALREPGWNGMGTSGYALKPTLPGCVDLLKWDDGATAVGMRPLGRGWVVHVGPQWGQGEQGRLLRELLPHFGASRRVPATARPAPGLHFRHFIGNTGLQDVWVLFNESDRPVSTELTFLPGFEVAGLSDIVTGESIPIQRDAAGDVVRDIGLAPHQTRLWVSPRSGVTESPLEWLTLQRSWWQGTRKPEERHLPTPAEQQRFTLELGQHWAYRRVDGLDDAAAAALAQPGVDDSGWERRDLQIWMTPDDHKPKRALLRRKFTVPASWKDGPVYLSTSGSVTSARTFLDGQPLLDGRSLWDGDNLDVAGEALRPGSSHLLVLDVTGSHPPLGVRGPAWLTYVPEPHERQSLAGEWMADADALKHAGTVTLPGSAANAAYLSRRAVVDAAHAGRNVVLYVHLTGALMEGVLVNGRRLACTRRTSDHDFTWFNVTPYIRFGEENRFELAYNANPQPTHVELVELRFYDRGVFP